ncbi:MAG: SDR family oxidoreductase [Planctomycetes bacterium]|nr:SDR family oxidoreductase [Planctomycetota bacterium]
MSSSFSLENKLVVITGGGTGIGFATAQEVIKAGGSVAITGRREAVLAKACEKLGSKASYFQNDVMNLPEIPNLIKRIETEVGPIYGLVNNAGETLIRPALETTDDDLLKLLTNHVRGSFAMTRECALYMKERNSGSVIFICSLSAIFAVRNCLAYTAGKAAMKGITRTLAYELAPYGIRVNDIAPGWIETDMGRLAAQHKATDPNRRKRIEERTPLGRYGEPGDIGCAAVYLLSQAAKFVTGFELVVDGGITNTGI